MLCNGNEAQSEEILVLAKIFSALFKSFFFHILEKIFRVVSGSLQLMYSNDEPLLVQSYSAFSLMHF